MVRRIVELRWRRRLSPLAIASRLSIPASTVHAVLVRCRLNRLSHIDIRTGEPIRRYEHGYPGAMLHVDVKNSATSPMAGAGGSSVEHAASAIAMRLLKSGATTATNRSWGMPTCTR
jgi:hypothetical protein